MSDLQISLLGIGALVIVAVYLYNWLLQRQYQRRFGDTFRQHEDALYHGGKKKNIDTLMDVVETGQAEQTFLAEQIYQSDPIFQNDKSRTNVPDEICTLLDASSDYIVEIFPISMASSDVLQPLWQRRFDFGKNVNVCGQHASKGNWEKVIAESHHNYSAFRMGLQLANRTGAVTLSRLTDFRDIARDIAAYLQAEVDFPDVDDAALRALQLDAFCAEVDQMIGINLLPNGGITLLAQEVAQVVEQAGMSLQADGAFHLLDARGYTQFSLCNVESTPFQHHTFNHMRVKGLTLLLDVPRVEHPPKRFDDMVKLARSLAKALGAALVDDHRIVLSDISLAQIREQVVAIEDRMKYGEIVPGSAKARRLFS